MARSSKGKGGSFLSAGRSKKRRASDESSESSDEDFDKAEKKLKAREETDDLGRTARARERENEALRERIRKADEERKRLNKELRNALNDVPDTEQEDE